jgi:Zn-finger nucleic acid-binding protein
LNRAAGSFTIEPNGMVYRDQHWQCPRCGLALESTTAGVNKFMRCTQCRGAFVDPHTLERMFRAMEGASPPIATITAPRPLPCPSCTEPMTRTPMTRTRLHAEGRTAELDTCAEHGIWFDTAELQAVLEAVGLAGLQQRRGF